MSSSSSPEPSQNEKTAAARATTQERVVSPMNAVESVDLASSKDEVKPNEPVEVKPSSSAESTDKAASAPPTPATLSVNEDAADDHCPEEQAPDSPEKKQEEPDETQESKKEVTTSSSRKRVPYKYDPDKVTLRFIFANRDGLSVTLDCEPADTVGEVKGALLSVWPKGKCSVFW